MTSQGGPGRKPLKVLVVDDTATNRQILQVFLGKLGLEVVTAADGALGVAAFERESPDLVIMDVMMPVMDGYEATRQIKAMSGERWVPVMFLSALDKEENLVAGLDAGGDDYLPKPVNFVVLDAKLRSLTRALALQRSLDDERRLVRAMSDNLVDSVLMIDAQGSIQWCNPSTETMFGYANGELLGKNVNILMPEPYHSEHDAYLARYLDGGQPHILGVGQRLLRGRRQSGEEFPLELGISEMRVGGERRFIGIIRDVSERVAVDQKLRENAERLQTYHDHQEAESALAQRIVSRQMQRAGLDDSSVRHWLDAAANFSGDIVAATRGPGGELYVLLADATGHGLGAAICTLPVLSVFYSAAETGAALGWILYEINRQLRATLPIGYFVGATAICIQADGRRADVWVGGTPDLLLLSPDGKVRRSFASSNLPLGIDDTEGAVARPDDVELEAGDQFVLFSDGLVEAEDGQGEAFGYGRLFAALASAPAARRIDAVREAMQRHLGGAMPHDDVSVMTADCGLI